MPPKPKKLHEKKARPISIEKSCPEPKGVEYKIADRETSVKQMQLELCWCIQQLERSLSSKKASEKQMMETWKTLKLLKSDSQPTIRKRQLMRSYFGDYRAKMQAEEKKLVKMASKMKITEKPTQKATFLRKSVFQSTGDSSFRFNFNINPEEVDKNTTINNKETGTTSNPNNNPIAGNTSNSENLEAGNTVADCGDRKAQSTPVSQDTSNFKFRFSESEFKFNFDVLLNNDISIAE